MTQPPDLLARVRKLLALATSPNVHEAAAAAGLAQKLVARHRLEHWFDAEQTAADDPDPIVDARDTPLETSKRLRTWKVVLASALAEANGCAVYTLERGKDQAIVLVGRARDRTSVHELWKWLVTRIEWLSASHGAGRDHKWHEAFRVGVVGAVAARLVQAEGEVRAEWTEGALLRVDPLIAAHREAVERFVGEHLNLGKGRGFRVDASAWEQGRRAGQDLDLGVGKSTSRRMSRRRPS